MIKKKLLKVVNNSQLLIHSSSTAYAIAYANTYAGCCYAKHMEIDINILDPQLPFITAVKLRQGQITPARDNA